RRNTKLGRNSALSLSMRANCFANQSLFFSMALLTSFSLAAIGTTISIPSRTEVRIEIRFALLLDLRNSLALGGADM
ncbi:MAG: hypothetical protein VX478_01505, partial [Chloroflexota bacterium]|nr:hypothetical protein [Chloroflexota bacterium]